MYDWDLADGLGDLEYGDASSRLSPGEPECSHVMKPACVSTRHVAYYVPSRCSAKLSLRVGPLERVCQGHTQTVGVLVTTLNAGIWRRAGMGDGGRP